MRPLRETIHRLCQTLHRVPVFCFAKHRYGARPAKPSRPTYRRKILLEPLEPRLALTGAMAPLAEIAMSLTTGDGKPVTTLAPGDSFYLNVYAQDSRESREGVQATYTDIYWDSAIASAVGRIEGARGTLSAGLIDEGEGNFRILMVARNAGELTFTADPADEDGHELRLNGRESPVLSDEIRYGTVSVSVDRLRARSLSREFLAASGPANYKVVQYAYVAEELRDQLRVSSIGAPDQGGSVAISDDGNHIIYTPRAHFLGTETFTYTISDVDGFASDATMMVYVRPAALPQVEFTLRLTRPDGSPITSLTLGDDFVLHVTATDLRSPAFGVFAAYLDVIWDSSLATVTGPVRYGSAYPNGRRADDQLNQNARLSDGLIDEVGGIAGIKELGAGAHEVFSVAMRAIKPGALILASNPSDHAPEHYVLVFKSNLDWGFDRYVSLANIRFGTAAIEIKEPLQSTEEVRATELPQEKLTTAVVSNDRPPGVNVEENTLHITGSDIRDNLVVSLHRNQLQVTGTLGGSRVSHRFPLSAVSQIVAHLNAGNDALTVRSNVRIPITVHAGTGNDNLTAGGGSAVLLGNDGNDRLRGGRASDLLIGGDGQDRLTSRGRNDLMIGGSTAYDDNPAALAAIRSEWASPRGAGVSPAVNLNTRLTNLRTDSGDLQAPLGISLQKNQTLLDDAEVDTLLGASDWTWLFADAAAPASSHGRSPGRRR